MSNEQLDSVLDTINRIIDLSESKANYINEKYKVSADLEVEKIKGNWQKKYTSAIEDIKMLVDIGRDEMVINKIKIKYGL